MISRRSFTALLGLSPLAGPVAAKAAVDAEIANLAGMGRNIAPAFQQSTGLYGAPSTLGGMDYYDKTKIAASEYIKLSGLPEFVQESLRRQSQYVGALDPDIAAKRSWSMSVKILTQRERNLERSVEALHHGAWHSKRSMMFKTLTGWEWPW
jgi:hypothetical protein